VLILLVVAGVLLLFGCIALLGSRKDLARRKRILDTPTSRIADAPGTGLVEIKGRIVAGEDGLLETPFSHLPVVSFRIIVEEQHSSGKNTHWVTLLSEDQSKVFYVDDGSGQTARIVSNRASFQLDKHDIARSGTWNGAPLELEAFLNSRGVTSKGTFGFNKTMRYQEETLAAGEALYALGPARREPVPGEASHTVPPTRLVLEAGDGIEGELILTNKTEDQLVARLRRGFIAGVLLVISALGLAIASAFVPTPTPTAPTPSHHATTPKH
jgi:hypothetical protein